MLVQLAIIALFIRNWLIWSTLFNNSVDPVIVQSFFKAVTDDALQQTVLDAETFGLLTQLV